MAIKVIHEPEPKPGTLGTKELYALAVGQVIGAGVITLIVPAIKMTGYSAWLAYLAAIIMGFIMILPTVFISSTLRLGGGNYSMLCDLAGPKVAGIFAYAYLTQCLSLSLFGASAAAYLGDIIPALNGHWPRVIVGGALLTFFFIVNLMGVDIMAFAQKIMTWLLIAMLFIFAVVGIFKGSLPIFDFADPEFLTQGWGITFENGQIAGGFTGAVLLLALAAVDGVTSLLAVAANADDVPVGVGVACFGALPAGSVFGAGFCAGAGVATAITATGLLLLAMRALL